MDDLIPDGAGNGGDEKRLTRAEKIFIRLSIAQTAMAVAGIVTGALALYAALTEAHAVRMQQAAAVWPEVVIAQSKVINESDAYFAWRAYNWGIGPGRIRSVRVTYDGQTYRDWRALMTAVGVPEEVGYYQSQISGRTLPSNEQSEIFKIVNREAAVRFAEVSQTVKFEACYCSVFDDCWMMPDDLGGETKKVKACPDFGEGAFQQ